MLVRSPATGRSVEVRLHAHTVSDLSRLTLNTKGYREEHVSHMSLTRYGLVSTAALVCLFGVEVWWALR